MPLTYFFNQLQLLILFGFDIGIVFIFFIYSTSSMHTAMIIDAVIM